jgi:hypothetical protein
MPRQMIQFAEPQMAFLKEESKRLGITVAELVRRIIDDYRGALKRARETKR